MLRGEIRLTDGTLVSMRICCEVAVAVLPATSVHVTESIPVAVTVWRNRLRAGAEVPTIDVFITACGEPPDLVLATMRAARDLRLPHLSITPSWRARLASCCSLATAGR